MKKIFSKKIQEIKEKSLRKKIRTQITVENKFTTARKHWGINPLTFKLEEIKNQFPNDIEKEIERRFKLQTEKCYGEL